MSQNGLLGRDVLSHSARATTVQRRSPKSAESARIAHERKYREALILSDFSVVGSFGQDALTRLRISLGLPRNACYVTERRAAILNGP